MNYAVMSAIKAWYDGAKIANETNGLWFQEVPPNLNGKEIERPYTVFEFMSEPSRAMTATLLPHWETVTTIFYICSAEQSPVEAVDLFDSLRDELDPLDDIFAAGYTGIRIDRVREELVPDPDNGWIYEVEYNFVLENVTAD